MDLPPPTVTGSWLLFRDFNQILNYQEKLSLNSEQRGASEFHNLINSLVFVDLKPNGNWFTWNNGRQGQAAVWEHLDRALCNIH